MIIPRIIPCLLLCNNGLVKGIQFKNYRYVGDPMNAVKIFSEKEADELLFLDITATKAKRITPISIIEKIADECYMPFGVGGGIKTIEEIRSLLHAGAEKVSINTTAVKNPALVKEASSIFGSQSIVVSIDVRKKWNGKYQIYSNCGTEAAKEDLLDFVVKMENYGAGEILINSIERDGTMAGYDIELIRSVANLVSIPVIACGGAGKMQDIADVIDKANASAAAAGSIFVFHGRKRGVLISYPGRGEVHELLKSPQ